MLISGLAHACFLVPDLHGALSFYRDLLGLEVAYTFRNEKNEAYGLFIHCGQGQFLEFFRSARPSTTSEAPFDHICLKTPDIARLRQHLLSAGLSPSASKKGRDGALSFWVKDPYGITVEFHQYTPGSIQATYASPNHALEP